jgi:hypothetical protein
MVSGGFLKWGGYPIAGWFIREKPNKKWMSRGTVPLFQETSILHDFALVN